MNDSPMHNAASYAANAMKIASFFLVTLEWVLTFSDDGHGNVIGREARYSLSHGDDQEQNVLYFEYQNAHKQHLGLDL